MNGKRYLRPSIITGAVAPVEQVRGLREAADALATRRDVPEDLCRPMRGVMRSAAEMIERHGSALGLPVNYALEMAGVILGEDLGHNR